MAMLIPTLRMLVIDPDPAQQQEVARAVVPRFQVRWAATLDEATIQIERTNPHVIILELEQPGADALGWIRRMRQTPPGRLVALACVTRRKSVRDKVSAFQAGADDFIVKPINETTFLPRMLLLRRAHKLNR